MLLSFMNGGVNMASIVLLFESITIAMKAKKVLRNDDIDAKIKKISSNEYSKGCGYGIEVRESDYFMVISLLQRSGISYSLVY